MVKRVKVVASESRDVLNYFGRCPVCDHPARAVRITAEFNDGRIESQVVASCGGWCGWKGPVEPTTMTGSIPVMTPGQGMVPTAGARPTPCCGPEPDL